ncbi:MAG: hypothetical protein CL669_02890 [Balneola sp.]|nr:hypothetical protein [Balneola sp.]
MPPPFTDPFIASLEEPPVKFLSSIRTRLPVSSKSYPRFSGTSTVTFPPEVETSMYSIGFIKRASILPPEVLALSSLLTGVSISKTNSKKKGLAYR